MMIDATKLIDAGSVTGCDPRWFQVVYTGEPCWGLKVGMEVQVGVNELLARDGTRYLIKDPCYDQYPILYPIEG